MRESLQRVFGEAEYSYARQRRGDDGDWRWPENMSVQRKIITEQNGARNCADMTNEDNNSSHSRSNLLSGHGSEKEAKRERKKRSQIGYRRGHEAEGQE